MDYGPWGITTLLYSKRGTEIYSTSDVRWVLKAVDDEQRSLDELRVILAIYYKRPRYAIALPPSLYGLYGRTPNTGWYALKRYAGHVELDPYCKERWRTLAIHVLQFLQDFHHDHGLLHMDIKRANILIDRERQAFVVADYEHADRPSTTLTTSYTDSYKWYYMAMGAELDQPLLSWRLDLVALGYLVASLTVEKSAWTFEQACWDKRDGSGLPSEEVVGLRLQELANVDSTVLAYLEHIKEVDWSAKEPPARSFYVELEELFKVRKPPLRS